MSYTSLSVNGTNIKYNNAHWIKIFKQKSSSTKTRQLKILLKTNLIIINK